MKPASEYQFLRQVLQLAKLCKWRTLHVRPGRTLATGWRTPYMGDGVGFVDVLLCRGSRLIFSELKTDTGRLTKAQGDWLAALRRVPSAEVYVWRPSMWPEIEQILA